MSRVVAIVEGAGEVAALPVLLRRLTDWKMPGTYVDVATPIRVRRDRFLNREEEFARHMLLAAAKCGDDGWILVVLDADDDCPAELALSILNRAQQCVSHRRVSVVLATREYEAWFIAAARSLEGYRGFHLQPDDTPEAETPRDAKGWVARRITGKSYRETTDQPAFTRHLDLQQAFDGSRSFRKLCSEWVKQAAHDGSAQ
jgi:hypothetical protein